ncbi:hypothetical protein PZ938_12335 [Luteipulveratus sp. YIM 133132]|uniref:hypothetical protein n=1 Tax=Luteipulveratus flavus TaxID=3031728 RepID=UPI0023B09A10|nr:hypothetical protein [Luteipulveratus sp. YIM 133132]MDE9366391.1 hypothetical protein [Luteipulveratus sp. YIM 133132]
MDTRAVGSTKNGHGLTKAQFGVWQSVMDFFGVGDTVISISGRLISEYKKGLHTSEREAHRLIGLAIIDVILEGRLVRQEPMNTLLRTRARLENSPLSDEDAEELSGELDNYLKRKNGSNVIRKDHEDKAIRAAFEVFYSAIEYSGLEGMALETEQLLNGEAADILTQ